MNGLVWPNGLVLVYELIGSRFESSCGHLYTLTLDFDVNTASLKHIKLATHV